MVSVCCNECGKSFTRKHHLVNHLRLHRKQKMTAEIEKNKKDKSEFRCALCWQFFGSQLHLKEHTELSHKRKPFRCSVCSFSTHYKGSLKGHDAAKHRPEYKGHRCRHCGASFVAPSHLRVHERIHTRQFPVNCPQCTKGFNYEWQLKKHLPTHEKKSTVGIKKSQGGFGFKCGKCSEVFSQSVYLKQHQEKTHPKAPKKFPCVYCDFTTNHNGNLRRHHQGKHLNLQKKFQCNKCEKMGFRDRSHLQQHLRVHSKEKPFTCNQCQKTFNLKGHLVRHFRSVHLKKKPFKCGECGKTFALKANLIEHQDREKGGKVPCPRCGLQMANKLSLAGHLRHMHGDQPMYKCWTCGTGLTTKGNLKKHQEKHREKPIQID